MQVEAHEREMQSEHPFVSTDSDHAAITAMTKAEDGNTLIIRIAWVGREGWKCHSDFAARCDRCNSCQSDGKFGG